MMETDRKKQLDPQFLLLSALGMLFVVDGHINSNYLDLGGFFPYYSFHVPLFFFISGNFYRDQHLGQIPAYIKKKAVRLMLPYFIYNAVYGCIAQLLHRAGFTIGGELTIHNLFVEPFITGHQFVYNLAAWFVPALFVVEIANLLIHRIFYKFLRNESGYLLIELLAGMGGVMLAMSGKNTGIYLLLVRTLFFLPFYQAGIWCRKTAAASKCANNFLYFGVIFLIQFGLHLSGCRLVNETAFCRDFTNPFVPYITAAAGIAFWLRIAKILAPAFEKSRFVTYFGSHTYAVMTHHLMALMAVKTVLALIAKFTPLFGDFQFDFYKTDIWYYYLPCQSAHFRIVYLFFAIALPLLFQYILEEISRFTRSLRRRRYPAS